MYSDCENVFGCVRLSICGMVASWHERTLVFFGSDAIKCRHTLYDLWRLCRNGSIYSFLMPLINFTLSQSFNWMIESNREDEID